MSSKKQYYVYEHPYVYVVLKHAYGTTDAVVEGVFTTKQCAEGCKAKLQTKGADGYISILKKPVRGPTPHVTIFQLGSK